jgi:hypothetical protein
MRAGLCLGFVLAAACVGHCDEAFARYDYRLSQQVSVLAKLVSGSGKTFSDWSKGRIDTPSARQSLAALRPPGGCVPLQQAALAYTNSQLALIGGALRLVRVGTPDLKGLREFVDQALAGGRLGQRRWFQARQSMMSQAIRAPLAPALVAFYRWQSGWLPIWVEQGQLSGRLEQLLSGFTRENQQNSSDEIQKVIRRTLALREVGSRILASGPLASIQQAALEEMSAFARVGEAAQSLLEDPSSDAVSRLHRVVDASEERSNRVEQLSLQQLRSALR